MLPTKKEEKPRLPTLRQDISISEGGSSWTGAPTWLIHDGFRNKYFRVALPDFELLKIWRTIPVDKFAAIASASLGREVTESEIEQLCEFLFASSLTQEAATKSWEGFHKQSLAGKKAWYSKLASNYIFFRIPLFRPQKFLDAAWPFISLLFTKIAVYFYVLCGLLGLYLVSRQWEVFQTTFLDFLTFEGFLIYGVSLIFIKMIHEMGHAFMARKYNVNVPIIGAAFIVLMPILYTDTTGATKLTDKKKRLMIDMAGIYTELVLASIATLLWVLLPDGPLRSVAFTTATLSWVLSLLVNLNPLMRFDGYYIVSDLFDMENLQERGFALARWQIREILFGLKQPPPEVLRKKRRSFVILHAWATWVYRFFLFLGIALIVYAFFIKLIGILLFIVEILWFILMPIAREIKHWWSIREEIFKMKRYMKTGMVMLGLLAFFLMPISSKISVPAILTHQEKATLYASTPSKVVRHNLVDGRRVEKGEVLIQMSSKKIESNSKLELLKINLLKTRISRIGADIKERSIRLVLEQELASKLRSYQGLLAQKKRLNIEAPISGILSSVDKDISVGIWINSTYPIAIIKPETTASFLGYVSEMDVERIAKGSQGFFLSDGGERSAIDLVVNTRAKVAASSISEAYFADVYGGKIPIVQDNREQNVTGGIKLRGGWYPLEMSATDQSHKNLLQVVTGVAVLKAEPISLGSKLFRRAASILIRELGI